MPAESEITRGAKAEFQGSLPVLQARIESINFEHVLLRHLPSSEMGKIGILFTANDAATWCWAGLLITIA